ncbi:class I SAM-dependent methyltransferase [Streptomyces rubiginosohelvolus]|uniref:class I SAM-dependent methyltransferase n=1 Tax=Streptomyces rubiginosohelvolus TaxID=67362 RepID=UPI003650A98E
MVSAPVPTTGRPVVVELGPGSGAFTTAIQQRLDGRGQHIAVELNGRFAEKLARSQPRVDVAHADARRLKPILQVRGLESADVIVSGLPWAALPAHDQRELLDAVTSVLPPHGVFTTFAYVHARWTGPARRLLTTLRAEFDEVVVGRTVWANLPPALVYHCRRPAAART